MDRNARQERRDAAHLWYGLALAAVVAGGVAFAIWRNARENEIVRVALYAGRTAEPDRGPVVWIAVATALTAACVAWAWKVTIRRADSALADLPDKAALDQIFSGAALVPVREGHAGMGHATLVVGGRERGYALSSQGADGSLVFERLTVSERTSDARVGAEQPENEPAQP